MEIKKITEGMTAVQVAELIDQNFKNQNKILEEDIAKQNNVIGVSEYKDFSEAEAVNVGDVRKYNGLLYECVEATTGAFDASKWKKSSFKDETEKKLSELALKTRILFNALYSPLLYSNTMKAYINTTGVIVDATSTTWNMAVYPVTEKEKYHIYSDVTWISNIGLIGFANSIEDVTIGNSLQSCIYTYNKDSQGNVFTSGYVDTDTVTPEGCNYMAVVYKTKVTVQLANGQLIDNVINDINNEIGIIKNNIVEGDKSNKLIALHISRINEGEYINSSGITIENSFFSSYLVRVFGYDTITFKNLLSASHGGVRTVQYDKEMNIISNNFTGGVIGEYVTIELDSNCFYISIPIETKYINDIDLYVTLPDMKNIKKRVDSHVFLKKGDVIKTEFSIKGEYVRHTDGTFATNSAFSRTDYILFYEGEYSCVKCIGTSNAGIAFYDKNRRYISGVSTDVHDITQRFNFTAPKGTCYAVVTSRSNNNPNIICESDILSDTIIEAFAKGLDKDWEYNKIHYLFSYGNPNNYSRDYLQSVYFESLPKSISFKGRLNENLRYGVYSPIISSDNDKKIFNHNIYVSDFNSVYKKQNFIMTEYKSKTQVAQNKQINLLVLADSLGDSIRNNLDGSIPTAGSFPSMIKELSLMDNEDIGNIHITGVGTIKRSGILRYKEKNIDCISCDEARASRTLAGYLRHFCHCIATITSSFEPERLTGKAVWDSLGLGTLGGSREYVEYVGNEEQAELIRTTCHGYYNADYTEDLFYALKNSYMYGNIFPSLSYSEANCKAIMDYALEHPKFPFYSLDKVTETNGQYAFSIRKMVERFRTLEDDGISVAVEKGIFVNDSDDYNVCVPTHVIIHLGINDFYHYSSKDINNTYSDRVMLSNAIHSEYPNIIIGHAVTRPTGVFNPEDWVDKGSILKFEISNVAQQQRIKLHSLFVENYQSIDVQSNNKNYYIPVYNTMSPYCANDKYIEDILDGSTKISSYGDTVHAGYLSEKSIAVQMLAWIYYTL